MIQHLHANIADIPGRRLYEGRITWENGIITGMDVLEPMPLKGLPYVIPGFVDAHVHIESSMLIPASFARMAVVHGTVATVSDPHEIANVCGMEGVEYMLQNAKTVPFKFFFGAPSCVPATVFETAGDVLNTEAVKTLLQRGDIYYLSEMMNFPGVLQRQPEVMEKIAAALELGKPVDGHAPGLRGEQAQQYIDAGISTDHECFTEAEALDKLQRGMHILVREGSAAKNFDALIGLLPGWYRQMMFCSDDKHPDNLAEGHINQLCARAVALGMDVFEVLQVACVNPVKHYRLPVGLLQTGDPADWVLVQDLNQFEVLETRINGSLVAKGGKSLIPHQPWHAINRFVARPITAGDLKVPVPQSTAAAPAAITLPVIEALNGQLITNRLDIPLTDFLVKDGFLESNTERDILKIVVVNRYHEAPVAKAFIRNTGLQKGAMASSVAHDSHNIVAIGACDDDLAAAIQAVMEAGGGLAAADQGRKWILPLPVAGLMTIADGYQVAEDYTRLDRFVRENLGCRLSAPFMTLSFMALLVIPHLKLSDKGLFDGDRFAFTGTYQ